MDDNNVRTVQSTQQMESLYSEVSRNCLTEKGNEAVIKITRPGDSSTRYTITIIDPEIEADIENMKFAAFVVPYGRENEWLFSSSEGRRVLRENCGVDRVAMITMHEGHEYPDFKEIKIELMDTVIKLAPQGFLARKEKVTFLTMPPCSETNKPNVRASGESKFSGQFIVEDVMENDKHFRRLIFLNREISIQSEVKLRRIDDKEKEEVDLNYITFEYFKLLAVGVSLVISEFQKAKYELLLVGLGGGVLPTLIHRCFKEVFITAVEIDEAIFKIAKEHFYLKSDERMKVNIGDGIAYLTEAEKQGLKYDIIMFDVDNKDLRVGMTSPPISFLQINTLNAVVRSLKDKGMFLLNLACRSQELRKQVFEKLRTIFAGVISLKTKEEVNEVVICWTQSLHIDQKNIEKASEFYYNCSKEQNIILDDDVFNISKTMESVKV